MTTEINIDLDLKHRAIRSGNRWAVLRRLSDGTWDTIRAWSGGRRSLLQFCEERSIAPSREAEQKLAAIPESEGFKERMP